MSDVNKEVVEDGMLLLLSELQAQYKSLEKTKAIYTKMLKDGNWWGSTDSNSAGRFKGRIGKVNRVTFHDDYLKGGEVSILFLYPFVTASKDWQKNGEYCNDESEARTYYPLSSVTLFKK